MYRFLAKKRHARRKQLLFWPHRQSELRVSHGQCPRQAIIAQLPLGNKTTTFRYDGYSADTQRSVEKKWEEGLGNADRSKLQNYLDQS